MLTRRSMFVALLAAPAIIRTPGLLMPVKVPSPISYAEWRAKYEHQVNDPAFWTARSGKDELISYYEDGLRFAALGYDTNFKMTEGFAVGAPRPPRKNFDFTMAYDVTPFIPALVG